MTVFLSMMAKPFIIIGFIVFVRSINFMVDKLLPRSMSQFLLKKR